MRESNRGERVKEDATHGYATAATPLPRLESAPAANTLWKELGSLSVLIRVL